MSEYKRLTARECALFLTEAENPTVLLHARPDGDTVGSAMALIELFSALGKDADYASADKIPERLEFLTKGKKKREDLDGRTLIAIDVASPSQLGAYSEIADRVSLMLDHHAKGQPFADCYILPEASSAGEVLMTVIEELVSMGRLVITEKIAYPLYASVSSDTGGFIYSSASPDTYRRAAVLMECGIDYSDINHKLFNSKSKEQIRAEGLVAAKLGTAHVGKIAYATVSKKEREDFGLSPVHFETAIDVVRTLMGAEIAIFVRENDDGTLRASLRSTGADVASVAAELNGGGHVRAAGCSPEGKSVEEGLGAVLNKIEELRVLERKENQ